jgi:hypothetical protein
MNARLFLRLLLDAFNDWRADKAPRMGAALAYYTLFAMAPLLVIAIAVAGLAFGREAAQGRIVSECAGVVGKSGAEAVSSLIENSRKPTTGVVATLLGATTLLLGASGALLELKDALNRVWDVERPAAGLAGFIRARLAASRSSSPSVSCFSPLSSSAWGRPRRATCWGLPVAPDRRSPSRQRRIVPGRDHRALRADLQDASRYSHRVGRRLDRGRLDRCSLHRGQVRHRSVSGPQRPDFELRCRRLGSWCSSSGSTTSRRSSTSGPSSRRPMPVPTGRTSIGRSPARFRNGLRKMMTPSSWSFA